MLLSIEEQELEPYSGVPQKELNSLLASEWEVSNMHILILACYLLASLTCQGR